VRNTVRAIILGCPSFSKSHQINNKYEIKGANINTIRYKYSVLTKRTCDESITNLPKLFFTIVAE